MVDIQNDFLEGGSLQVPESLTILKPVNELIEYIKSKHGLIIATQVRNIIQKREVKLNFCS